MGKMKVKTCNTCHVPKPLSEFYKRGDKHGYRPDCKECYKKKDRLRNNSDHETARVIATKEIEARERNPHGCLAADIIEQAIIDYGKDEMRGECLAFFCGPWFEELCDMVDVDAECKRKQILEEI